MARREFQSPDELVEWLAAAGIDMGTWGVGDAKTATNLWQEYVAGESAFEDNPPGRLVEVVQLRIRRGDTVLVELAQEFADGRTRVRWRPPSEKMKRGETMRDVALRCLREELGLEKSAARLEATVRVTEIRQESPSYPGLPTRYVFHIFSGETDALPDGDFHRDNAAPDDPIRRHLWGWRAEDSG